MITDKDSEFSTLLIDKFYGKIAYDFVDDNVSFEPSFINEDTEITGTNE